MRFDVLLVVIAGLGLIAWINWYFFLAPKSAGVAAVRADGRQDVAVIVRGGYEPATIHVDAGHPVRVVFDRRETSGCSEEVVFPALGIRKFLPAHAQTPVETGVLAAGTYEFTCGMGMLRGTLVAR